MNYKVTSWFDRISNSQTLTLGSMAVVVGLGTTIGIWSFKWLIEWLRNYLFVVLGNVLTPFGSWTVIILPMVGGLIVGIVSHYFLSRDKLYSTAGIMQSIAMAGGKLRYQRLPIKTVAAVFSIGSGASVGSEDPSVQIGANLGSMLGQLFHMSDERIRTLTAAGGASAIAAAFNAPIAGVFFALEIILGEIAGNSIGVIIVAAVTSSVFSQAIVGTAPTFKVPAYAFNSIMELPLYLILGLLAGLVSALYVQLLRKLQDVYQAWSVPQWVKPVSAGLAVGVTGIFLPQIFGVGYGTISEVLNKNDIGFWLLVALLIAKVILTPVSIGGGFFGGVFAPALFIGTMLGGAFGLLLAKLLPGQGITPTAFVLVGMAAVLAGAIHAPLTAFILLFEMTNDFHIILPLMFAVAVSFLLSQRIQKDSVYTLDLVRNGIRFDHGYAMEVMGAIMVGDAMQTDILTLPETMDLTEAAEIFKQARNYGLPVINKEGWLIGILTIQDMEHATGRMVGEACTRGVEVTYPDETLDIALRRMRRRGVGRLPVVARENPRKVLGILSRIDLIYAYDIALTGSDVQRHQMAARLPDPLTPVHANVSDLVVEKNSPADGKRMDEIIFPRACVIASVRRSEQVFIPYDETLLRAGDILMVIADDATYKQVQQLCSQPDGVLPGVTT